MTSNNVRDFSGLRTSSEIKSAFQSSSSSQMSSAFQGQRPSYAFQSHAPSREMSSAFQSHAPSREMSSAFGSGGSGREMPSAFGSGDRDRKRDDARAYAERKAADDRAKRLAAEKEAKRLSDATNFASVESYPALGAGSATKKTTKSALNFSAAAAKPAALRPVAAPVKATIIPTRCYDELPEDYDGPDEGEEEEEDGEFNADLGSTRRRGDKGIW